jgi:beta-lactamase regulating signal transducer with metallopeptidase domain
MTALAMALNSALLQLVWQGLVVAFLLWMVLAALRRKSASARYLVSCAALAVLTVLPIVTACLAYQRPFVVPANAATNAVRTGAAFVTVVFASPISSPTNWLALIQAWMLPAWACGVAFLSMRLLWGCSRVSSLKRTGDTAEPAVLAMAARLSERIGVTRAVRVLVTSLADGGPCVIGALRPVVLLPAATLLGLTAEQLEAVLAHELAHIRRYDYLVNMVQMLIETLFFYHPAVWWISGRIRQERELCCDDIAVRCCGDAVGYARALTALERIRVITPSLALGVKDGPLMYRVQRLLGAAPQHAPREDGPARMPGILAMLMAAVCFSTDMNPVRAQAPIPQPPAPQLAPIAAPVPPPAVPARPSPSLTHLAQATQPAPPATPPWGTLSQTFAFYQTTPAANPTAQSSNSDGGVTLEVTIGQYGEVNDARVVSGPMSERRSALLTALQTRFPAESASTTRQMQVYAPYPSGTIPVPNRVAQVLTPVEAQARLTAASERLSKLKAQQADASERGAAQLQTTIDSLSKSLDNLRQVASGQNPLVGKTLEDILITGVQVSYSARDELRAKLPVHLRDVLSEDNMAAALSMVKGIYPYAEAYFGTTGSGQAGLLVTVPVR